MTSKAAPFDRLCDAGARLTPHLDRTNAPRPNLEPRRVNVDFPEVKGLDARAAYLGITRQALIKIWIAERLECAAPSTGSTPGSAEVAGLVCARRPDACETPTLRARAAMAPPAVLG